MLYIENFFLVTAIFYTLCAEIVLPLKRYFLNKGMGIELDMSEIAIVALFWLAALTCHIIRNI